MSEVKNLYNPIGVIKLTDIGTSRKLYIQYPLIVPIRNHKSGVKPSHKHPILVALIRVVPQAKLN